MLSLVGESWTWYGLTWAIVIVRMASRRILLGSFRKLQLDDVLMLIAMLTDTVLIIAMNIVSKSSSNLLYPGEDISQFSSDEIDKRIFGSKMVLVVEQMQCITIWLVKACLLLMYHRLTMSLKQNLAVKIVAGYAGLTFIVMEILYLGVWCRPFTNYWAFPTPNTQCSAATNHLITNAVFNISSDLMIILIPMPIFLQSTLTLRKKLILCGVFAVGTFTIISAILNKYYSFTSPFGVDWTYWYIRESSTALIAANLPLTWTFFQRVLHLQSFKDRYNISHSHQLTSSRFRSTAYGRSKARGGDGADGAGGGGGLHPLRSVVGGGGQNNNSTTNDGQNSSSGDEDNITINTLGGGASQERINQSFHVPLRIYQKKEVQITTAPADLEAEARAAAAAAAARGDTRRGSSLDSLPDAMLTQVHIQGGRAPSHLFDDDEASSISDKLSKGSR